MNRNLPPTFGAEPRSPLALSLLGAAGLIALLVLYRPYEGVAHDARIYIGQAMAALDPAGVGRDLMFVQDRQSGLSIFPMLVRPLVAVAGPAPAALVMTFTGLLLWLGGAVALTGQLARGRLMGAALVCILVLAPVYGGMGVFAYAEPFATPRPFAEAAILAALAALLAGRQWVAIGLFAIAAALHPIMALPGAAAGFVLLAWTDRRWLLAAAAVVAAVAAAAVLRLPLAERLLQPIDPVWLGLLEDRNTYLFPSHWTAADFARIAVHLLTLGIASAYVPPRVRVLFAGVAAAGLGGLLATWLFGEVFPSVLVAQMQLWRGLWLVTLSANAAVALAAAGLWREGSGGRLALAALAMAWLSIASPVAGIGFALGSLGLQILARRGALSSLSRRMVLAGFAAAAAVALVWALRLGLALADYLIIGVQAQAPVGWAHALDTDLPRLPPAAAAVAVALGAGPRLAGRPGGLALAASGVAITAALAVACWDARPAFRRVLDAQHGRAALATLLARAPGEILWVGGDTEAWLLAGRANWSSDMQGAGIVFSRPLAVAWDARIRTLVDLGLARAQSRRPFAARTQGAPVQPTRTALEALCAQPDGPAAVVVPGRPPAGVPVQAWRAAEPRFYGYDINGGYAWRRVSAYSVIDCDMPISPLRP